jgi:hypothetical protein
MAIKPVLFGWAIATAEGTMVTAAEVMNLRRDKRCFMGVLLGKLLTTSFYSSKTPLVKRTFS